ncbi:hypothetical protein V5O48_014041, partial [Marasmius crinis-equi]
MAPTNPNPTLDAAKISEITQREKELTGQDAPVKGGPAANAQKHTGEPLGGDVVSDIAKGEANLTGGGTVAGGPAAFAQSQATRANAHSGRIDSTTLHNITQAEKELTGADAPVRGGPTAQAQKHVGEELNSQNLHDIHIGEQKVTGMTGEGPVKGGPTATAQ